MSIRAKRIPAARTPSGLSIDDDAVTDWPTIREWVLERDGYLCQICKIRPATDADHIWPRRLGGGDHIGNLRAACGPCNKTKGDRVDFAAATTDQLVLGTVKLASKIAALEEEMSVFTNHLCIRALAEGLDSAASRVDVAGGAMIGRGLLQQSQGEMLCVAAGQLKRAAEFEHSGKLEDSDGHD